MNGISGLLVSMVDCGFKPETIEFVFVASLLRMQH